jgi:hypothetical protein
MIDFHQKKSQKKETIYASLINDIYYKGWNIEPLLVITAGARGAIYQTTKYQLKNGPLKLKLVQQKKASKTYLKTQLNSSCKSSSQNEELKITNHYRWTHKTHNIHKDTQHTYIHIYK